MQRSARRLPLLLTLFAVCFLARARADILYTFALTSSATSQAAGSGSFTLSTAPPPTGTVDYLPSNSTFATPGFYLLSFDVTVNNPGLLATYTLSDFFFPYIRFIDGAIILNGIEVQGGSRSQGFYNFGMSSTEYSDNFIYFGANGFPVYTADTGSVTITPQITPTPESSTLVLFATGTFALAAALRRHSLHRPSSARPK